MGRGEGRREKGEGSGGKRDGAMRKGALGGRGEVLGVAPGSVWRGV